MKDRRYLIYGVSPLMVGVAEALHAAHHGVMVLYGAVADEDLLARLPEGVMRERCSLRSETFLHHLQNCECLLALEEEDQANLRVTIQAHRIAPKVPVVTRTFDSSMAEALEEGVNVRRAFSLSALAAPAFVADLLAEKLLTSLNLAGQQIIICLLTIEAGSRLEGLTREQMEENYGCLCLGGSYQRLTTGQTLVLGGIQENVLGAAAINHPPPTKLTKVKPRRVPATRVESQLGLALRTLLLVLALAVLVFWKALQLAPIDAVYFVVTTATTTGYGDISLKDAPAWLKIFGCLVMLAGGGLVAVLFSHLSAMVSQDRGEERMGRRALEMRDHVILAGLGRIGYRVEQLLASLHIPCVVLDRQGSRFTSATGSRSVVLRGDAAVPEDLERAGLAMARAFVGCTDNDLLNLQSCLQARKINPAVYTVARIQDGELAESLATAFSISSVINPVAVGVGAFVGAATDERALRHLTIDGQAHLAFRHRLPKDMDAAALQTWTEAGIYVVAVEIDEQPCLPKAGLTLPAESWCILLGNEAAMRQWVLT